jgi:hypothetical protein
VLYGSSSADFVLTPLSRISGGQARCGQDIGGIVTFDTPGIVRYPATKSFGNFAWDIRSLEIQPFIQGLTATCSVYCQKLFKYRVFFDNGKAISGNPKGDKFEWSTLDYGITVLFAIDAEINGVPRTFYADSDGWVYEADVGRSFAGETISWGIYLQPLWQRNPMTIKTFRYLQIENRADSYTSMTAFSSTIGADSAVGENENLSFVESDYRYVFNNNVTVPCESIGQGLQTTITGASDNALTHTLYSITLAYTGRRLSR